MSNPNPEKAPRADLLVVDDEAAVATVLARGLTNAGYRVAVAGNGQEALEKLEERRFDLLLTDVYMPRLRGDELQRLARAKDPDLAVLLITAIDDTACAVECLKEGAYDFLLKPFDLTDVVVRVEKALERRRLERENREYKLGLERRVAEKTAMLRQTVQKSLESLIHTLEAKDPYTQNHSLRVAELATEIVTRMRSEDAVFISRVRVAAIFHDIGKIGVPEEVLNKPSRLTREEMALVEQHPVIGETILAPLLDPEIVAIVRHHHEHLSGKGYPDGLAGDAIPLGARIVAVADAFDAMTSTRPHRTAHSVAEAIQILRDGAGVQWDREAVFTLLRIIAAGRAEGFATARSVAELMASDVDADDSRLLRHDSAPLAPPPGEEASVATRVRGARSARPVLTVAGNVNAETVRGLRDDVDTILSRGAVQVVLDLSECCAVSDESAQALYALDLQARRSGGRLVIRDAPETILVQLHDSGVAGMLLFEKTMKVAA
jgi:putative nucleotidyltransferase with HDIG domain